MGAAGAGCTVRESAAAGRGEVEKAQKKAEKEETIGEEGQGPKETFTKT